MKVGIDVSQVVYGTGVSDYTVNLYQHLPPEVMVPVGFSLRRQADLKKLIPLAKIYPLPPTVTHLLWNQLHQIPIENFTGAIDVFHSSDWTQAPSKAKKVTTIHDLAPFIYPQETLAQVVTVHTAKMRWVVKECDAIICVSQNTKEDMSRLFPDTTNRLIMIPEALPSRFTIPAQPSPYSDYVVTIGSKQPRKNIARLIRAFDAYSQTYHLPSKLVIIGDVGVKTNNPNIITTGYLKTQLLINILAGAQALIYPSLYEGFGLPVLEAFYHQVPVVCSQTSSLPEVAGKAAVFIDPTSEISIAQGISTAISQRSKLISAGLKQLTHFSWENTAKKTLEVYKSLC